MLQLSIISNFLLKNSFGLFKRKMCANLNSTRTPILLSNLCTCLRRLSALIQLIWRINQIENESLNIFLNLLEEIKSFLSINIF